MLLALSLAACGSAPTENSDEVSAGTQDQVIAPRSPEAAKIACASPGSSEFAQACTVDRAETPDGVVLTLRHPGGAFHRLLITRDGRGVIAADGAEPASVTPLAANRIEVALGGARYRLPAIVGQPAPR